MACLPGIIRIILNVGNFRELSVYFVLNTWVALLRQVTWDATKGVCGFSEVCLGLNSWYVPRSIIVQNWLVLSCVLYIAPPKKNWNSNKICPSLNIMETQVETFLAITEGPLYHESHIVSTTSHAICVWTRYILEQWLEKWITKFRCRAFLFFQARRGLYLLYFILFWF